MCEGVSVCVSGGGVSELKRQERSKMKAVDWRNGFLTSHAVVALGILHVVQGINDKLQVFGGWGKKGRMWH